MPRMPIRPLAFSIRDRHSLVRRERSTCQGVGYFAAFTHDRALPRRLDSYLKLSLSLRCRHPICEKHTGDFTDAPDPLGRPSRQAAVGLDLRRSAESAGDHSIQGRHGRRADHGRRALHDRVVYQQSVVRYQGGDCSVPGMFFSLSLCHLYKSPCSTFIYLVYEWFASTGHLHAVGVAEYQVDLV